MLRFVTDTSLVSGGFALLVNILLTCLRVEMPALMASSPHLIDDLGFYPSVIGLPS